MKRQRPPDRVALLLERRRASSLYDENHLTDRSEEAELLYREAIARKTKYLERVRRDPEGPMPLDQYRAWSDEMRPTEPSPIPPIRSESPQWPLETPTPAEVEEMRQLGLHPTNHHRAMVRLLAC